MYDQSFNYISLSRMLRKNDFYIMPRLRDQAVKKLELENAVERASLGFVGCSFLSKAKLRGKDVYRVPDLSDELVLRKIDKNLRKTRPLYAPSRDTIIANVANLISESVQYKVYRLDIKSFYESFDVSLVVKEVNNIKGLGPQTKRFVKDILDHFAASGGRGLPRGLALSATLSEIVMASFDNGILSMPEVFYYSRYVDDVIIITSGSESAKQFINNVSRLLPNGLFLNKKKEGLCAAPDSVPFKATPQAANLKIFSFEYLGYSFTVYEPAKAKERREVVLDIAESKVKKIKTRLTRACLDYCRNRDFNLLEMRVKFLTSNYSVLDINRGGRRLAGIYHNYHRVNSARSFALDELDRYLKLAALSGAGKVFDEFYQVTSGAQRRRLVTFSFKKGFNDKVYVYFNRTQFKSVRECWEYA